MSIKACFQGDIRDITLKSPKFLCYQSQVQFLADWEDGTHRFPHIPSIRFWNSMPQPSRGQTLRHLSPSSFPPVACTTPHAPEIVQKENWHFPLSRPQFIYFFKSSFPNPFLTLHCILVSILDTNSRASVAPTQFYCWFDCFYFSYSCNFNSGVISHLSGNYSLSHELGSPLSENFR